MNKLLFGTTVLILMASSVYAQKSLVTLESKSYKEIVEVNKDGEKEIKLVEAKKVLPGDVVLYKNTINNDDKKSVKNMVLNNPIPKHTQYVEGSAKCKSGCDILFSIDGGKVFDVPSQLMTSDGDTKRVAYPDEYTNVRWVLTSALEAKSSTFVSFKTKLK
jgi:uncharacterized repeat protein (TIGR01451 family)